MASSGLPCPVPMVEKTWNLTRDTPSSSAMPSRLSASLRLAWLTVQMIRVSNPRLVSSAVVASAVSKVPAPRIASCELALPPSRLTWT